VSGAAILPPRGEREQWAPFAMVDGLRVCSVEDSNDKGSILATAAGFCVLWDDQACDDVQRREDGAWVTDYGVELARVGGEG